MTLGELRVVDLVEMLRRERSALQELGREDAAVVAASNVLEALATALTNAARKRQ